MISVIEASGKKLLRKFIDFPHELYKEDKNYVPELFVAQKELLTPGKHPFYENAEMKLFLAEADGIIKGRIAAIFNRRSNEFTGNADGFFGFFDCVNDENISAKLFETAETWLRSKGLTTIIGPVNPTTNDVCGLLIEGFDSPPVIMMPYNSAYYAELIQKAGFVKEKDLFAWKIEAKDADDRSVRLHKALEERLARNNIVIRKINVKNFKQEAVRLRDVYNMAWDKNFGFVPMTDHEFDFMAKELRQILNPNYCLIAEKGDKIVGFALALPDINQILIKIKNGRLLPTGIFKLLFGLKKIKSLRILLLGVIEGYKKLGIEACFYASIIERAAIDNIPSAEASWILEDNFLMNKGIQSMNGKVYKKYRLFEKKL